MATLQELLAQKAAIEKQIIETQRQERTDAIARVRALMAEYGLSAADIAGKAAPMPRRPEGRKVAPGVYWAKLRAGRVDQTVKIAVIR